jgi:hypothetical protein
MTPEQLPLLAATVLLVAFLYSSVGHAGASGYIAVMSLFSLAPGVIKSTARLLNILVTSIRAHRYQAPPGSRAPHRRRKTHLHPITVFKRTRRRLRNVAVDGVVIPH